ncbi:Kynurenine--oxoglutarate transaminase [Camellia lanceoleosa]|uniref:Kynurenine--oxoglutarate transaminase n=1 Tax=Camellia lanceoleosa TaxID=1840588 RepID=A0ACC0FWR8_9ERIC|nr:Kynurenine--oxoglutarate transaminase [Camellia lanceoleosa]
MHNRMGISITTPQPRTIQPQQSNIPPIGQTTPPSAENNAYPHIKIHISKRAPQLRTIPKNISQCLPSTQTEHSRATQAATIHISMTYILASRASQLRTDSKEHILAADQFHLSLRTPQIIRLTIAISYIRNPTKPLEPNTKSFIKAYIKVYEHITYDNKTHISLASLPRMQRRTIITSSLSKTYSVTGILQYLTYQNCWRIGWVVAPACIASVIRNIHTKLMDSAPAPFQEAALTALRSPLEYFESLRRDYESRRNYTIRLLARVGFQVQFKPQGSFFLFAELLENCALFDMEFVEELIKQAGVVAVLGFGFFHRNLYLEKFHLVDYSYQERYIRFAFCKSGATLFLLCTKIGELVDSSGLLKLFKFERMAI